MIGSGRSTLAGMTACGINTYSESRIELRNPQILKKMLNAVFCRQPKRLDIALNTAGVEIIRSENSQMG